MAGQDGLAAGTRRAGTQCDHDKRGIAFVLYLSQRHMGDPRPALVLIWRVFLDLGDNGEPPGRAIVHGDHIGAQLSGLGDGKVAVG